MPLQHWMLQIAYPPFIGLFQYFVQMLLDLEHHMNIYSYLHSGILYKQFAGVNIFTYSA